MIGGEHSPDLWVYSLTIIRFSLFRSPLRAIWVLADRVSVSDATETAVRLARHSRTNKEKLLGVDRRDDGRSSSSLPRDPCRQNRRGIVSLPLTG